MDGNGRHEFREEAGTVENGRRLQVSTPSIGIAEIEKPTGNMPGDPGKTGAEIVDVTAEDEDAVERIEPGIEVPEHPGRRVHLR